MSSLLIEIVWEGPLTYDKAVEELSKSKGKGIYQIYGHHLIFGSNSLLYIGKTERQTLSKRLYQHDHWVREEHGISIYVGEVSPTEGEDGNAINTAEELLIYVHQPPYNASDLYYKDKYTKQDFRIYNFGERMSLLPELSTDYWRRNQKTGKLE